MQIIDPEYTDVDFEELSEFLAKERGFSFDSYKDSCINRRVLSRVLATGNPSLSSYITLLKSDAGELNTLYDTLTINVSSFFRNKGVYDFLTEEYIPDLIKRKKRDGDHSINIWSAGCSTGEEPYSILFSLRKRFDLRLKEFQVRLLATDIDSGALKKAEAGVFKCGKMSNLDHRTIRFFFVRKGDEHQVKKVFRDSIDFMPRDLFNFEDMDRKFDIIFCRNVMIYFNQDKQRKIYDFLSDHLAEGGILVLGKAEIMFFPGISQFEHLSVQNHIYRKI